MSFDLIEQANVARVLELEAKIQQARETYYNNADNPPVSDAVYDAWVDELQGLSEDSPQVTSVGAPPPSDTVSSWPKAEHSVSMGSLDKVQTFEAMTAWVQDVTRVDRSKPEELFVTEKLDGISISLRYEEGVLVQALTRGDGFIGEDITPNVSKMKGVLAKLPESISATIRGEILLLKEDYQLYFQDTANSRNTASGTAKRLDGKGCEHLTVLVYQVQEGPELHTKAAKDWMMRQGFAAEFQTETDQFEWLNKVGFQVPGWYLSALAPGLKTPHDIWTDYQQDLRDSLPYTIDGLVVRLNDLAYQWSLGEKNGRPLGAVAFKFASETRETVALGREDQTGGTGRINPVAVFEAVTIQGAEITRASLYNQKYIEQIGFDVGAKIIVSRANDVIPRVESVSASTGTVSKAPTHCPECGAPTEREGEYVVCPNTGECPAQTEGRLRQWIRELGILEWGPQLVQKLVQKGVATVPDLYRLTVEDIASLERMGDTSAQNAIKQLWGVVPLPLEHFLGGLSIPLCATSSIQTIMDSGFDTLEKVQGASQEDLQAIPGIGPKRAFALRTWLDNNGSLLSDLLDVGVTIKERATGNLTGKSVCFTGKSTLKRPELERLAKEAGGAVKKSVGKGLTYLVMADPNSTSTKAQAAQRNGTVCISETEFLEMVNYAATD